MPPLAESTAATSPSPPRIRASPAAMIANGSWQAVLQRLQRGNSSASWLDRLLNKSNRRSIASIAARSASDACRERLSCCSSATRPCVLRRARHGGDRRQARFRLHIGDRAPDHHSQAVERRDRFRRPGVDQIQLRRPAPRPGDNRVAGQQRIGPPRARHFAQRPPIVAGEDGGGGSPCRHVKALCGGQQVSLG